MRHKISETKVSSSSASCLEWIRQKRSLFILPLVLLLSLLDGFFEILPRSLKAETTKQKAPVLVVQPYHRNGYDRRIEVLVQTHPSECRGKERLLDILLHAGHDDDFSVEDCLSLPHWSQVTDLYGELPVVYGLDTCERYQQLMASNATLRPAPRVAGLYDTGSNALAQSFNINFETFENYERYYMSGGKHMAPKREWQATFSYFDERKYELPVVLIRDPFRWMLSMCREGYNAKWTKGWRNHCPNLVPNRRERQYTNATTFSVNVSMKGEHYWDHYESLSDLWSSWYRLWLDADYPRLIIRFEDTLFHAEQVTDLIAKCAGLDSYNASDFKYHVESAKQLKSSASFTSALSVYGRASGRYKNLESQDIDYLRSSLDSTLLNVFQYRKVPWNVTENDVASPVAAVGSTKLKQVASTPDGRDNHIAEIMIKYPSCDGKERLLEILMHAGHEEVTSEDCDMLPTWTEVVELYGDEPVVYGLDSCERYRYEISAEANGGLARDPAPRVAGMFNTGTNALAMTFNLNLKEEEDFRIYNMPGGKHVPASWKYTHNKQGKYEVEDLRYILPVVIVRDPLRWMHSMCGSPYGAEWQRGKDVRCPNLVPSDEEQQMAEYRQLDTFTVEVDRDAGEHHASLADMWTEWNLEYADATFPRLMVRFEDLLFHAERVTQIVAQCVGFDMSQPFRHQIEKAKSHTDTADFRAALAKYGRSDGRYDGLLPKDLAYASKKLDPQLLRVFHYPPVVSHIELPSVGNDVDPVSDAVLHLVSNFGACSGKEKLLMILLRAGVDNITQEHCASLPRWEEVLSLYGDQPVIYGMETCERYRHSLLPESNNGTTVEPAPRVAGLFNTGTNALAQSLSLNFKHIADYKEYNVPSRKHVPARDRWLYDDRFADDFTTDELRQSLPIVLVRDPFRWMLSMCKSPYNAEWERGNDGRCPNLLRTESERQVLKSGNASTFELTLRVREVYREKYESLATLWSEWNRLYLDTFRPRLMIRFEDTLFHPEKLMHVISECVGRPMSEPFKYVLESSKNHGNPADFITALAKYGTGEGRYARLTVDEVQYLQTALNSELMQIFGYKQVTMGDI